MAPDLFDADDDFFFGEDLPDDVSLDEVVVDVSLVDELLLDEDSDELFAPDSFGGFDELPWSFL